MNQAAQILCPVCEEGILRPGTRSENLLHNGREFTVDHIQISICDNCGSDVVTPAQVKQNRLIVADARRRLDGLLTSDQIKAIRKRLSLSQKRASVIFGGGECAFSKYEIGTVIQSTAMDHLLRLVDIAPVNLDRLAEITKQQIGKYAKTRSEWVISDIRATARDLTINTKQHRHRQARAVTRFKREPEWRKAG